MKAKRSAHLDIRIAPLGVEVCKLAAKKAGKTMSAWIREVLWAAAKASKAFTSIEALTCETCRLYGQVRCAKHGPELDTRP